MKKKDDDKLAVTNKTDDDDFMDDENRNTKTTSNVVIDEVTKDDNNKNNQNVQPLSVTETADMNSKKLTLWFTVAFWTTKHPFLVLALALIPTVPLALEFIRLVSNENINNNEYNK